MLAKSPNRACLRPLLSPLLDEGHPASRFELGEPVIYHAVAMKVDLKAVSGLKEAVILAQPGDGSDGLFGRHLHLALDAFDSVVELTFRPPECLTKRKVEVGMALVRTGRPRHIDLASRRQLQPDRDLEWRTLAVMLVGCLYDNSPGDDVARPPFNFSEMPGDRYLLRFRSFKPLEVDLDGRLHEESPFFGQG